MSLFLLKVQKETYKYQYILLNVKGEIGISPVYILLAVVDLGGVPGTRPSKGPDSFVSTYKIFEM